MRFFRSQGKKFKNLGFLGEIFQAKTQTKDGQPDPGEKFLTWIHH